MKKSIYKFSLAVLAILVYLACTKEPILEEPSHRVIFTSEMDFENTIEVNGELSFGDVSAGVESRLWTFPDNVVDIVDSDNDKTSTEATVKTIFTSPGVYDVHLQQTFKKDAFVGEQLAGRELDTTIVITVLDSIEIGFKAYYINRDGSIGEELDISNNAENEIPAARSVRFEWSGKGVPRFLNWDFGRADPGAIVTTDSIIDVKYKFLGMNDISIIASRQRPAGADTLYLENFMKVVPSTDPVQVERISDKDGKIAIEFSRELESTTLVPEDFTFAVFNEGNLITETAASIDIDPNEGNVVIIDLGEESIYNDDTITVSFQEGNLFSLDGVKADAFTDELLTFNKENILATNSNFDYSFEVTSSDNWVMSEDWDADWSNFTVEVTSEMAFTGEKSALIEIDANGNMIMEQRTSSDEFVLFPANSTRTYEIGSWVYVESLGSTAATALQPDLRFYWKPEFPNSQPNPVFESDFPLNQWVYSSNYVKFDATGDFHFEIRGFNASNPEKVRFFLDEISLSEVTLRP